MIKKIFWAIPIMLLAVGIHPVTGEEREFPAIDFSQVERGEDEIGDIAGYAMDGDLTRATVAPTTYYDDCMSMVIRDVDGRIVETYGSEYFDAAQLADGEVNCADALRKDHVVASSQYETGYGYCVTIIDEEKRVWKYGHCSELLVEEGATVSSGDIIAYAGNSGITTGGLFLLYSGTFSVKIMREFG